MNDLAIQTAVVIPVLWHNGAFWRLPFWHNQASGRGARGGGMLDYVRGRRL